MKSLKLFILVFNLFFFIKRIDSAQNYLWNINYIIKKIETNSGESLILAKVIKLDTINIDTFYMSIGNSETSYTILNNNTIYFYKEQIDYDPNANSETTINLRIYTIIQDKLNKIYDKRFFLNYRCCGNHYYGKIQKDSFYVICHETNISNKKYADKLENITIEKIDSLFKLQP